MILVDTSIWVDHLRSGDSELAALLDSGSALTHPFVIGEIACGNLANRKAVLELMQDLPAVTVAEDPEVLHFIARHRVYGQGLGYIDAHLLASTALTAGARLWTRDKRLRTAAQAVGCAHAKGSHH